MTIKYHFFGKNCKIDNQLLDRSDLENNLRNLDFKFDDTLFVKQIHSNKAIAIDDETKKFNKNNRLEADAIITNQKNIAIGIVTADCAPILLFDKKNNIIAAIHAGWRGALSGIIENSVKSMIDLGAKNISCEIGPMIQQNSYEVSQDLVSEFTTKDSKNNKFFAKSSKKDKFQFNLNGFIEECLNKLPIDNIENNKIDTLSDEKNYHSYRRSTLQNQDNYGRNLSIICIT